MCMITKKGGKRCVSVVKKRQKVGLVVKKWCLTSSSVLSVLRRRLRTSCCLIGNNTKRVLSSIKRGSGNNSPFISFLRKSVIVISSVTSVLSLSSSARKSTLGMDSRLSVRVTWANSDMVRLCLCVIEVDRGSKLEFRDITFWRRDRRVRKDSEVESWTRELVRQME